MKNFLFRVLCGFVLGISVFAPGVSGSVMAIIMGVYEKLVGIIAHPFRQFKKNVAYLLPMAVGAAASLAMFVLVFSWLFERYEFATFLFFMGLVAGNLPVVFRDANKRGFHKRYLIGIFAAFAAAVAVGIAGANAAAAQSAALVGNLPYLALCGAVAGAVSLIPGKSISTILMILGVYATLLFAAKSLDWVVIGVVGIAFLAAMFLSSRLIKYVFTRFYSMARFMVFGFMAGSVAGIAVGLPAPGPGFAWWVGALAVAAGLAISLVFVKLGRKFSSDDFEIEAEQKAPDKEEAELDRML